MDEHDTGFTCPLCHTSYMYGSNHAQADCRLVQIYALRAEVARLREALAKYTEPLTWAQSRSVCKKRGLEYFAEIMELDAAIRRVRKEQK